MSALPAELVVFIALFLLRRRNRLRKGQRQRIAVVRTRLSALYCNNPTWIVTVAYTVTVPV